MRNGKTIPVRKILAVLLAVPLVFLVGLPYAQAMDVTDADLEMSYHGTLGHLLTADVSDHEDGMLEKWCALPDLNIGDDGFVGFMSWTARCGTCHIGGSFGNLQVLSKGVYYDGDQLEEDVNCFRCHVDTNSDGSVDMPGEDPTNTNCMTCHKKEVAKRGYDATKDVHMVDRNFTCQTCHVRFTDDDSNHQLAKGTTIDTSLQTAWGSLSELSKDCAGCHSDTPHRKQVRKGGKLDKHFSKVACETCHTGFRGKALESRSWQNGSVGKVDVWRSPGWLPVHKWYDGTGSPEEYPASGHLPILQPAQMKDNPGAKIYPFNDVEVTWWIKDGSGEEPPYDDVIPLSDVNLADGADGSVPDGTITEEEMRAYDGGKYPYAALIIDTVCFNVSHSVVPKEEAFNCDDCHGDSGYVLNWEALGYDGDPADHHGGMD